METCTTDSFVLTHVVASARFTHPHRCRTTPCQINMPQLVCPFYFGGARVIFGLGLTGKCRGESGLVLLMDVAVASRPGHAGLSNAYVSLRSFLLSLSHCLLAGHGGECRSALSRSTGAVSLDDLALSTARTSGCLA